MSAQPNHYEVLGLPSSATSEQIKKRYRELARRYHPDVNPHPEAISKILLINQAYEVLGDADRRSAYDAERLMRQAPPRPAAPSPPKAASPNRPGFRTPESQPESRAEFNGFGRTYPGGSGRRTPPHAASRKMPDTQGSNIEKMVAEAKLAFINHQFQQAEQLCMSVLRIHPREATVHEILGDIFVRRGDTDRATTAFAYAIQLNPRNQSAQAKLERLMRRSSTAPSGPAIYSRPAGRHSRVTPIPGAVLAVASIAAGTILLASFIFVSLFPGNPIWGGPGDLLSVSANFLVSLTAAGISGGSLLACYGNMRPAKDELWSRQIENDAAQAPVPLGLVLILFSLIWFYASFLTYIGIAATRNRFSPTLLKSYAATFALIVVFTLLYHPSEGNGGVWRTALLAGNLLFPTLIAGWMLGDAIRLRGRL